MGKLLAAGAAAQMKRVSLELGGHAPFLVFDDADPVHAAKGAAAVKFLNTGPGLHLPQPLLRPAGHRRRRSSRRCGTVSRRCGPAAGLTDGVTVGPLIDDAALAKMERQVADARAKGATVELGR